MLRVSSVSPSISSTYHNLRGRGVVGGFLLDDDLWDVHGWCESEVCVGVRENKEGGGAMGRGVSAFSWGHVRATVVKEPDVKPGRASWHVLSTRPAGGRGACGPDFSAPPRGCREETRQSSDAATRPLALPSTLTVSSSTSTSTAGVAASQDAALPMWTDACVGCVGCVGGVRRIGIM